MATRTHVILSDDVLEELDKLVGKRKRSQFIEEAVRARLQRERQHTAVREGAGILKDSDIPEWATPEKTYEWIRRSREMADKKVDDLVKQWQE